MRRRIKPTKPDAPRKVGGRPPALQPWQISYARHARQVRHALKRRIKAELSDVALGRRFDVSSTTIMNAVHDVHTAHRDAERERGG